MKKLQCRVLGGDALISQLKGKLVTVKKIGDSACSGGFGTVCVIDEDVPESLMKLGFQKGSEINIFSDDLEPVDVESIPVTHKDTLVLRQVWVFCTAKNDAWYREEPTDKARYREATGCDWKDERTYDVGKRTY